MCLNYVDAVCDPRRKEIFEEKDDDVHFFAVLRAAEISCFSATSSGTQVQKTWTESHHYQSLTFLLKSHKLFFFRLILIVTDHFDDLYIREHSF